MVRHPTAMKLLLLCAAVAAGCGNGDETIVTGGPPRVSPSLEGALPSDGTPLHPANETAEQGALAPRPPPTNWADAGGLAGAEFDAATDGAGTPTASPVEAPIPSLCEIGLTESGSFQRVETDGVFAMKGGAQANLVLSLAVRTATPIPLTNAAVRVEVTSDRGNTANRYRLGGPSSACGAAAPRDGCDFMHLNVATEPLSPDPFDLENLAVIVEAVVTIDSAQYCDALVKGRLRRAN